jgi:hypothetical protein
MKKLANLSNPILFSLAGLVLFLIYVLAINPTVILYQQLHTLENQQQLNQTDLTPKGNLQELKKLDSLLVSLKPQTNIQSIVLKAVGNKAIKLQSFKEVKLDEKEFGGAKNIKKHILTVSGKYAVLLRLCEDLQQLAISSSRFYLNDEQEKHLSLVILESTK